MSAKNPRPVTTEVTPPGTAQGPQHLLDFARLWVGIRRKRRLWLTFGLLGLIAGGLFAVLMPPPPTAVVRILVVHEDDSPAAGGSLILTDVALMTTTKTAGAALEKLGSAERPEEFVKEYEVVGVTNNVLEVTVKAPTGAEAARRANALAEVFITEHVARIQNAANAEAKAITDQRAQVQKELDGVNGQISGAEQLAANQNNENGENGDEAAPPPPNAAGLDSLYAQRAELTDQISQLTQQAQQTSLGAPRVVAGTQVVDAPRPVRASLKITGATNAGIGLVLGLVVGITLAAVTGVVRDRPVLRRDVAENLGASVIAQLPAKRRGVYRFLPNKRAAAERRRVAATLVRLVRDGSAPVSVLELGAAPVATALAADVAAELATDRPVALVTDLPRRPEAPAGTEHPVRLLGADDTSAPVPGEVRIGLGSVAPGTAWTDLAHLGGETLLVVRAGYANAAWLHTVARQLADVGIPVVGVVLVDPDPRDSSDGTLWDGLHTALRGRARHEAAVNGTATATTTATTTATATNGTNGRSSGEVKNGADAKNGADLPTKRLAPVTPPAVHDLPTKRFAPVRKESDEVTPRRTQG
jgi:capsular polysaccharide biosynthesis protein